MGVPRMPVLAALLELKILAAAVVDLKLRPRTDLEGGRGQCDVSEREARAAGVGDVNHGKLNRPAAEIAAVGGPEHARTAVNDIRA